MAKQTFTTGQVLTAAQMTSLQQTAMLGGSTTAKTANYVLVAADAGTVVAMNAAGSTTITVNSGLFAAGDIVTIMNYGAGTTTITAGTATINTAGSLAIPQYDGGILYFTSASAAIYYDFTQVGIQSPLTTKGDLWSYSTTDARLASSAVNGQVLTVDTTTATGLKWATPATGTITWTRRLTLSGNAFTTVGYNGSNLYIAAGANGELQTSPDGITWTSRTSGFGAQSINKVHWASGLSLWIIVGNNGLISTSSDGITWTARTANMSTNAIYDVFSSGTNVVAVGQGGGSINTGGITYSTNGTTWTRKSQTVTIGSTYTSVMYNGSNWIVGAYTSTNNTLTASTPAGTWTAAAVGGTNNIMYAFYDGTGTILVALAGTSYYSTSSTYATWDTMNPSLFNGTNSAFTEGVQRATYYNGKIYWANYLVQGANPFVLGELTTANTSNFYNDFKPYSFAPATAFSHTVDAYFVGAAGQIICAGRTLYTSF